MDAQVEKDKKELMQRYNFTEQFLQTKCSKFCITEIGKFISWDEVGRYLPRIERIDLSDIDRDGRHQQNKRQLLLDLWKDRNGDGATYDIMITAMLKARKKARGYTSLTSGRLAIKDYAFLCRQAVLLYAQTWHCNVVLIVLTHII